MKSVPFLAALWCLTTGLSFALQVDPATGDDHNNGVDSPVKTIARAVALAGPGDTIHLTPGTYHESVVLRSKKGLPGRPITVDGHGAVIDGSDPLDAAAWEPLGGGIFRKVKLMPNMAPFIVGRWFFLWDGRINRMGRSAKGPSAPLKKVADLQPGEWTYVTAEDAFYLKLPEGQTLEAANIRWPVRANGVALAGSGGHIVIKNITATHVYNDGFNVHGAQVDTVFENIAAIECGDDGFSAHETGECRIDGFTSMGNSTGFCDIGLSTTHYRNVFIKACLGFDIYFIGNAPHSVENARVESSAAYPLMLGQPASVATAGGPGSAVLKNVLIRRSADLPGEACVHPNFQLDARRCTFIGMDFKAAPGSQVAMSRCLMTAKGETKPVLTLATGAAWKGDGNHYDLGGLNAHETPFTPATFDVFQKLINGEAVSRWAPSYEISKEVGADETSLPKPAPTSR